MWLYAWFFLVGGTCLVCATRPCPFVSVKLAVRVACDCILTKLNEVRSFQSRETLETRTVMLLVMLGVTVNVQFLLLLFPQIMTYSLIERFYLS